MGEAANRRVIERLIDCINARQIEIMDELFHEDAVMDWPQSKEMVVGAENRRAIYGQFPSLPTVSPRRMLASGDFVILEASLSYGDRTYLTVFIFELTDGRIKRETAYWSDPFEAPEWRARWVTQAST
jgi:hypothetical protein